MATTVGGVTAGIQPIPTSLAGTTLAGNKTDGTQWTDLNAQMAAVVTNLVKKEVVDILREKAVILQEGSYIKASHVPGTRKFVYTAFADLGDAEDVAEGTPPITVPLAWDTMEFTGSQKAKIVAISDLAELFSPHGLYSQGANKIAWNMVDTMEKVALAAFSGGLTPAVAQATVAENLIAQRLVMKVNLVPEFPEGGYKCFISPTDLAAVVADTSSLGYQESIKYKDYLPLANGEVGRFRGLRFIETTRVADGSAVIFGPEFFAWGDYQTAQVYRVAAGGDHADPLAQRTLVGWKGMFGATDIEFPATNITAGPNPEQIRYLVADLATTA